jgi:hypothetical protein
MAKEFVRDYIRLVLSHIKKSERVDLTNEIGIEIGYPVEYKYIRRYYPEESFSWNDMLIDLGLLSRHAEVIETCKTLEYADE